MINLQKKVLFISFNDLNKDNYGGAQCSLRNYKILTCIGQVDHYIIEKKSSFFSLLSILLLKFPPISYKNIMETRKKLVQKEYDFVFLDSSLLGLFAKLGKKYRKKTVTFFHNIELDYNDVRFGSSWKKYPYKLLSYYHEKLATKYSDIIITLNNRDKDRLFELYGVESYLNIPITFEDRIKDNHLNYQKNYGEEYYIFVGAFSIPNYEGIKWFVENVANKINCKLKIIGKGFEKKREELSSEKVEVIGFVDDLTMYYNNAEFVVSPLLDGAGMKVKIAEALMYGKTIFATKESFEGYDITEGKEGYICENVEDFIYKINSNLASIEKSNKFSRELFLNKYSNDFAIEQFKKIIM